MTDTASTGKVITLEYTVKAENNEVYDTNVGQAPFTYTQGSKEVIHGVQSAVEGMAVGQTKQVVVPPTEGYGERDPNAVAEVSKANVPKGIGVGTRLEGKDESGREISLTVTAIKDQTVLLDLNHPLAGKTLYFDLKVINIT